MDTTPSVAVERYLVDTLLSMDEPLRAAAASTEVTQPGIEVSPLQGALLGLLVGAIGGRRVLEFGTLAGFSTTWLARAVGAGGRVVSLEISDQNAAVARRNLAAAGVDDRVEVRVGPAADTAAALLDEGVEPFDLVFIDADKPTNPRYLALSLHLTHPGSLIVIDNVVRGGRVADEASSDADVRGVRQVLDDIAADDRLEATALQTVGSKGWDGLCLVRRVG